MYTVRAILIISNGKARKRDLERCKKSKADTIEELAKLAGIDAKGLKENIDKYNSDIDSSWTMILFSVGLARGAKQENW